MPDRLQLSYCDHHDFPLPAGHKFPLAKYRLLRDLLSSDTRFALRPADVALREDLLTVHDPAYVDAFLNGTLEAPLIRRIGLPWSRQLVLRTLASVGSTLLAADSALRNGIAGTLAGGTHHAYRAEGSGFCVFNDLAIAIEVLRSRALIRRAAVIDLDVHQGDGTAAIFANDADTFTLSLHGARNFPFRKQKGVLDIELQDETSDEEYLAALEPALQPIWTFRPDLVLFQSGVDALATDRLGRLALTLHGLGIRDRLVIEGARSAGIPLAITLGGGYSDPIEATVVAHAQTFQTAADIFCCDKSF
ncbi:MAG: histone deacetylase [Acidobacteriaceae bacterium]|nr:histone deacetylase [Acidobacteriaceae bacterium]